MSNSLGDVFVKYGVDLDGLDKAFKKTQSKFKDFSKSMETVGTSMTKYITVPLSLIGGMAFKASNDMNSAMADVATLIPGSTERVRELKKEIQDLSLETGKSSTNIADGAYQVISAWGDAADTTEKLETAVKGSVAGKSNVTDAINLTSAVTKGYGDTTAEAVRKASDLAFTTVKLGQTTFPELASSMGRVVSVASELGSSQEELFTGFATLTGVTGNTAEVSTQLFQVYNAFLKPSEAMQKAVKGLGYESASAMVQELGLVNSLRKVVDTTSGSADAVAELVGNVRALPAALSLTGSQAKTFDKKLKDMQTSAGATDEAFKEQAEGINKVGFNFQKAMRKVDVARQNLGDSLAPVISKMTDGVIKFADIVQKIITAFDDLNPGVKTSIAVFLGLAAVAGPVAFGIAKISAALTFLAANPIVLAIAGVAALTSLMIGYAAASKKASEKDLIKKMNEEHHERLQLIKSQKQEIRSTKNLMDTYRDLYYKANKTTEEKYQLKKVSGELAEIYPSAIKGIDNETKAYILQLPVMRSLMNEQKNLMRLKLEQMKLEDDYDRSKIMRMEVDARVRRADLAKEKKAQEEKLETLRYTKKKIEKELGKELKYNERDIIQQQKKESLEMQITVLEEQLEALKKQGNEEVIKSHQRVLESTKKELEAVTIPGTISDTEDKIRNLGEQIIEQSEIVTEAMETLQQYERIEKYLEEMDKGTQDVTDSTKELLKELEKEQELRAKQADADETLQKRASLIKSFTDEIKSQQDALAGYGNMFDRNIVQRLSPSALRHRLSRTLDAFKQFQENLKVLKERGMSQEALAGLTELGPFHFAPGALALAGEQEFKEMQSMMENVRSRAFSVSFDKVKHEMTGEILVTFTDSKGNILYNDIMKMIQQNLDNDVSNMSNFSE